MSEAYPKEVVEAVARAICSEVDLESPDDQVPYNDMLGGGMMPRWQGYIIPARRALAAIPTAGFVLVPADVFPTAAVNALMRCDECWDDGEGTDVGKPMLATLESLGWIVKCGRGKRMITDAGNRVLAARPGAPQP